MRVFRVTGKPVANVHTAPPMSETQLLDPSRWPIMRTVELPVALEM